MNHVVDCSIVIVSWNTRELLARCLESVFLELAAAKSIQAEIIVVDNASSDGTVEMIRQRFPDVRLLVNESNVGFGRANNLARPYCQGRHILLLNPDTEIRSGALSQLVAYLDSHSSVGGVGPQLLNPDGSMQLSCYPAPTLVREGWRLFHLDYLHPVGSYPVQRWSKSRAQEVDVLMGACLLLRRSIMEEIGWFDADFFMYSEEVDLCHCVRQKGWILCWLPTAHVVHFGGQSTQQIAEQMFCELYRSKVLFFRKHYGPGTTRAYKLLLLAAAIARLTVLPVAWLMKGASRDRYLGIIRNYRNLIEKLWHF